jgi:hypothetical protein
MREGRPGTMRTVNFARPSLRRRIYLCYFEGDEGFLLREWILISALLAPDHRDSMFFIALLIH